MTGILTSWKDPEAEFRKFYASVFMFQLSKTVDRKQYEAVTEGYLDLMNQDSPQVELVIYDKMNGYKPAIVIDFSSGPLTRDHLESLMSLKNEYHIPEVFLYDLEKNSWQRFPSAAPSLVEDYSDVLKLRLGEVLDAGLDIYRLDHSA